MIRDIGSIVSLGKTKAIPALAIVICNPDEDEEVALEAAIALRKILKKQTDTDGFELIEIARDWLSELGH